MKKIVACLMTALFVVALSACERNAPAEEQQPLDMTPSFTQEELEKEVDFETAAENGDVATADSGEVLIDTGRVDDNDGEAAGDIQGNQTPISSFRSTESPDAVWADTPVSYGNDEFTLPDAVLMSDGSLGTLSIPKISLTVPIYETDDEIEAMANGVAHMKETSCWAGNVGLAGHNRGVNTFFGKVHSLAEGDTIKLTTALGTRTYNVVSNKVIDENDWSSLGRTEDNRITLITCVDDNGTKRVSVQAVEVL